MPKPLIGVTCGIYERTTGEMHYGVLSAYTNAVTMAGGLPLLIAPNFGEEDLREIYARVDGVLLTGGGDVEASLYGMADDGLVHNIRPDRDATEINVARWAAADDKPMFGICRGVQVANVALGGTLYRDIAKEYPGSNGVEHDLWGKFPRGHEAHVVQVDSGTRLADALGTSTVKVNTLHHQALRDVPANLKITAHASDGLIEGVEIPGARFFVGVQWHPEEMVGYSEPMRRLFAAFVDASRRS